MKLVSVSILMISLLAATFSQWLAIACFNLNEAYITEKYCVNKNDPAKHCNGHCYLAKQMNNEEESSNLLNTSSKTNLELQLFYIDFPVIAALSIDVFQKLHPSTQNFTKQEFNKRLFHPPTFRA